MSKRKTAAVCAAVASCAGFGALASTGLGDDTESVPPVGGHYRIVEPALQPGGDQGAARAQTLARRRGPKITNLITRQPQTVPAGEELVLKLTCQRRLGIALDGGVLSPPAPAGVAVSVISRFNPNTLRTSPRSYFVGVRNFDMEAQFRGSLVCAKGIRQ